MMGILGVLCLIGTVALPAILNIIAYPVSKRWSMAISNYISDVCAPRVFAVLDFFVHFHFWGYQESKKELPDNFIIISNHQSLLDIPVYFNFFKERECRFVAKDALGRHVPLVSEMLRTQEHCIIPRKAKPMDAMKLMGDFGKRVVARNQIPVLFPEGTRTRDGNVGKFYAAGFRKLTESADLPVVVCALDGGYELRDLPKLIRNMKGGCYRVKALKVFDNPKTKEEAQAILDESRELIQKQLEEWRKLPTSQKY